MTTVNNSIDIDKRFISHNQREYNVFSRTLRNPSNIEKWVGLSQPHLVVMDPETYWSLRGERLEWKFDDENRLTSVYVHASKTKTKAPVEEMEEEPSGKRETPTFESMEEKPKEDDRKVSNPKEDQIRKVLSTKEDDRKVSDTMKELEL